MTHQHRHAERSCPSSTDGEHDRLGMRGQLWKSDCENDVSWCFCTENALNEWKARQKVMKADAFRLNMLNVDEGSKERKTHDCAEDLEPEAFPPDLPPVILNVILKGLLVKWRSL
jgi:hypothetical protein